MREYKIVILGSGGVGELTRQVFLVIKKLNFSFLPSQVKVPSLSSLYR